MTDRVRDGDPVPPGAHDVPIERAAATPVDRRARRERLEELFAEAVDLPATARAARIAEVAAGDPELATELGELVALATDDARLVTTVAAAVGALAATPAAQPGGRVGPYRLRAVIGEGGMGTVYLAERDDAEYRRRVAIKILRNGLGSTEAVARFRDERQLLAQLDHPSIVRLLDGGTTDAGLPYLVMEHVAGEPLTTYARGLDVRGKVELIRTICGAVQHAHQKLIVHRDIKPGNILVDRAGVPKLLDFGIAKLLDDDAGREAHTRTGMALLTAEYASPEQARGQRVTVATDVYALGAVLYELLVGAPPQRAQASMLETLRVICEVEPARPSAAAPAAVRRELAGDLDNIALKALAKDPGARYGSAAELADDLERWQTGQPVSARAATFRYRAGKFVRRHRAALALAAVIATALTAATVSSIVSARRASRHAAAAARQTAIAEQQTRDLLVAQALEELRADRASRALPYLVEVLRQGEDTAATRFLLAEALRPLELQLGPGVTVREGLVRAAWSPDGETIALAGWGVVMLADPELRIRAHLETIRGFPAYHAGFTPDGRALVAAVQATDHQPDRQRDNVVLVWDTATGAVLHRWPAPDPWINSVAVDDRVVAVAGTRGGVAVWDLATGTERLRTAPGPRGATHVALAGGGRWMVLGSRDGTLEWRDLASMAVVRRVPSPHGRLASLHPTHGGRIVVGWEDGTVSAYDGPDAPRWSIDAGGAWPLVAGAGDRFATQTAGDTSWRMWSTEDGRGRGVLVGGPRGINELSWGPGDARVTMAGDDTFQVWSTETRERELLIEAFAAAGDAPHAVGGAVGARIAPDGTRLLTTSGTEAQLWRLTTAPLERELRPTFTLYSARWSPDERAVVAVGNGAAMLDATTGAQRRALDGGASRLHDVAWSHDGRRFVVVGVDGAVTVFAADGTRERALVGHRGPVNGVAWSPYDRAVVTAGADGSAIVWDPATGAQRTTLAHPGAVSSVSWSADGTRIATAAHYRTLRIWDVASERVIREFSNGFTQYLNVEFSPDGTLLASGGHDGEVSVWDLASGTRRSLDGHTGAATEVEWSPDGALLASAGDDGTVRIWDPAGARPLAVRSFPGTNIGVSWSRDGQRLMGVNHAGGVRIWSVARDPRPLAALVELARDRSPWSLRGTRLVRAR